MLPTAWINMSLLLPAFLLVASRISGLVITAPLFGSTEIPTRVKTALVIMMSATVFPTLLPRIPQDLSMGVVLVGMVGELTIGLTIGLGLSLVLLSTQMMGLMVGQQAGLALASAFDPITQTRSSIIGQIYFWTATTVFLIIGGHRVMIRILLDSFSSIPVMRFEVQDELVTLMAELMMDSMILAVRLAGPMILALLLAKLSLGFLSKTMPQLHILSVGFAVFVSIGIFLSALEIGSLYEVMDQYLCDAFEMIRVTLGMAS